MALKRTQPFALGETVKLRVARGATVRIQAPSGMLIEQAAPAGVVDLWLAQPGTWLYSYDGSPPEVLEVADEPAALVEAAVEAPRPRRAAPTRIEAA